MRQILIIAICGFLCVSAKEHPKTRWVLASDLDPSELTNLTSVQEHELHLKKLSQKDPVTLTIVFALELIAKGVGSDLFGFAADDTKQQNGAIAKATFEAFTKIHLQSRILDLLTEAARSGASSVNDTGLSAAFTKFCMKMDQELANETIYTSLRDKYAAESESPKRRTYLYGVPKSEEELRKSFAELSNDPLLKKLSVHITYSMFNKPEELIVSKSILELAMVAGNLETVQKIYEQTVDEAFPLVNDTKPEDVDINNIPLTINHRYLKPVLSEKLQSKINENADLKSAFEPIKKRIHEEIFPELRMPKT